MLPWWLGPLVAAAAYCALRWPFAWLITPDNAKTPSGAIRKMLQDLSPTLAMFAAIFLLFIWCVAQIKAWGSRRLLDSQSGLDSIRRLTWREFEELLCEAFRREGFAVEHTGFNGPDGGVDIRLQQGKARSIVQCKHWKRNQVGVAVVREMFGLLHSERADSAVVVTSGAFTPDAITFAQENDMRLIDGEELVQMISAARVSRQSPTESKLAELAVATNPLRKADRIHPSCPRCGASMRRQTAKQGIHEGKPFWGCMSYPKCKGILNIADE